MTAMRSAKQFRQNPGYPRNWEEFREWFPDDEACAVYLAKLRWPSGYVCPNCGPVHTWTKTRGRLACSNCRRETTVTAGTVFDGTHKSLHTWFEAVWHLATEPSGMGVKDFQRMLGLGSYKTAWAWMRRLRLAMAPRRSDLLRGLVEVDVLNIEGKTRDRNRRIAGGASVAVAAEVVSGEPGRVRVAQISEVSERRLTEFVISAVEPGAFVHTADLEEYLGLESAGYDHSGVATRDNEQQQTSLISIRPVAAALGDWLFRARTKGVLPQPLDLYLDQFNFRFNHRLVRDSGELFYLLLQHLIVDGQVVRESVFRAV